MKRPYNREVIQDFEIVPMFNFITHECRYAILAKWGPGRKQGYLFAHRFNNDNDALTKAQELMPELPVYRARLIETATADYEKMIKQIPA